MAIYRSIQTAFWQDAKVLEEMTPEDRYFYLYLLTNPAVKQVGIYQLTRKQMAFELGYSMESVNALLERFIHHHDIIRYDYDTREICIVNWGKYNFPRAGTPIENCIRKELREVKQTDFIKIIYDKVENKKIKAVFDEYFNECPSRIPSRDTSRVSSRGEKEKQKEKQKEKEQQHSVTENKDDEVRLLKSSFSEISDEDIETILGVLEQKREGISYLREKIEVVKNTDNVKSIVGYLIKAILNDYKKFEKKGSSSRNKFKNFDETVTKYSSDELEEKIRQSQNKKFG
jgi:hypothetical protein